MTRRAKRKKRQDAVGAVLSCELLRLASERVRKISADKDQQSTCVFFRYSWDAGQLLVWRVLSRFWSGCVINRAVDILALGGGELSG